jgi:hypothetical protein
MLQPNKSKLSLKDKIKVAKTLIKQGMTPKSKKEKVESKKSKQAFEDYKTSISNEFKKGGSTKNKNWIQDATASIKRRGTEGKCTPITKPGCTGKAKALAKTFKKIAKNR